MIDLASSDFVPLEHFSLRWRFDPARVGDLPSDVLARIRPLNAARAADLELTARAQWEAAVRFGISFRSDDAPGEVRARLLALPPEPSTIVLVSWNAETAVATDWDLFVTHWDDFCYPSSDVVAIWPLDRSWTLCYRHYEIFQFRDSRQVPP